MLRFVRQQQNSVKQLSFNKKIHFKNEKNNVQPLLFIKIRRNNLLDSMEALLDCHLLRLQQHLPHLS